MYIESVCDVNVSNEGKKWKNREKKKNNNAKTGACRQRVLQSVGAEYFMKTNVKYTK